MIHARTLAAWLVLPSLGLAQEATYPPPAEVKAAFLAQLDRPRVAPDAKDEPTDMAVAPGLVASKASFASDTRPDGSPERVPVLIIGPDGPPMRRPAVIVLHGTGGWKEAEKGWLESLAKRGIVGVAIDARYHGARAGGANMGSAAYNAAIIRAWKAPAGTPTEHPFYYDTAWDLLRTVDFLQTRPDVDPGRIGMIGISMGGIQTWLAAAVDDRIAVAVPAISVQSFRWSLEHDRWQGRARTIAAAHDAAAKDLGKTAVDREVCRALWDKVIPGILGPFDCPSMLRLFAGRALLIVSGDQDPNCPVEGAQIAIAEARKAFEAKGRPEMLKIMVAKGVGHSVTAEQRQAALEWCVRWLKPESTIRGADRR